MRIMRVMEGRSVLQRGYVVLVRVRVRVRVR